MSLNALRKGQRVQLGATEFRIVQKLADRKWQLQSAATGEWCVFAEDDLLDRFARKELSFITEVREDSPTGAITANLNRDLSTCPPELVTLARNREQYLKEIDRRQPISITRTNVEPLIRLVAERIKDEKPPGWLTVWRDLSQVDSGWPRRPRHHFEICRSRQKRQPNAPGGANYQRSRHLGK